MSRPTSTQRLVRVGRVHLVGAAVAELRRRVGGLAERAVEGRGVLGRVGQDRDLVVAPPRPAPRGSRPPGRPSCPRARPCPRRPRRGTPRSGPAAPASGSLSTSPSLDDAAVAVAGVLAEADVGDDEQVGVVLLQVAHGGLDRRLVVVGLGPDLVLVLGNTEQQHRPDALLHRLADLFDQAVRREVVVARHRRDLVLDALPVAHEERVDEIAAASRCVSRTMSRIAAVRRSRRGRASGKHQVILPGRQRAGALGTPARVSPRSPKKKYWAQPLAAELAPAHAVRVCSSQKYLKQIGHLCSASRRCFFSHSSHWSRPCRSTCGCDPGRPSSASGCDPSPAR